MKDIRDGVSPRSVFVASDGLYLDIADEPSSVALLEDLDAMVIPYSVMAAGNEAQVATVRDVLRAAGQLIPGSLLIRNPYEAEAFEFSEYALESFASAKYHHLANVAKLLGAKEVQFEDAKVERQSSATAGGIKAIIPGFVSSEADVTRNVARKLDARLEGRLTFEGGEPDTEAAFEFLNLHNLANDQQLRSLVEMRGGSNPIKGYKMTLSGTREADANLRAALSIAEAVSGKGATIGMSLAREVRSIRSIEITTSITF